MTQTRPSELETAVRNQLRRIARERGDDFQLLLTRYANERLLFRLATSKHAPRFVLKGASLFTLWTGHPHRSTRDIDLLGFGEPSVERVRQTLREVLELDVADDGVRFDLATFDVSPIREEQAYGGVRAEVVALVTTARIRLQIDVGFGDAITPEPDIVEFPTLLDFPAPRLCAYPRETVVAEKLEAMVHLGLANSRMKDFYDVALLARSFDFDGPLLVRAIRATFERRKTRLPLGSLPTALTSEFTDDPTKKAQWSGFVRKSGIRERNSLAETVDLIRAFVEPPLSAAATQEPLVAVWSSDGAWNTRSD